MWLIPQTCVEFCPRINYPRLLNYIISEQRYFLSKPINSVKSSAEVRDPCYFVLKVQKQSLEFLIPCQFCSYCVYSKFHKILTYSKYLIHNLFALYKFSHQYMKCWIDSYINILKWQIYKYLNGQYKYFKCRSKGHIFPFFPLSRYNCWQHFTLQFWNKKASDKEICIFIYVSKLWTRSVNTVNFRIS